MIQAVLDRCSIVSASSRCCDNVCEAPRLHPKEASAPVGYDPDFVDRSKPWDWDLPPQPPDGRESAAEFIRNDQGIWCKTRLQHSSCPC